MRLLARGRDAEVFALDGERVLRRAMDGRSLATEAAVMAHAHAAGVPVPAVHDVTEDGEIVMDRVYGPTLFAEVLDVLDAGRNPGRGPDRVDDAIRTLLELHDLVHAVPAPPELPRTSLPGDRLLHLDLHLLNIIQTPDGPVLIDWAMARAGPAAADLAMTYILHAGASAADAGLADEADFRARQRRMSESLLARVDVEAIAVVLPQVAAWRCADRNVSAAEADRVRSLVAAFPAWPE